VLARLFCEVVIETKSLSLRLRFEGFRFSPLSEVKDWFFDPSIIEDAELSEPLKSAEHGVAASLLSTQIFLATMSACGSRMVLERTAHLDREARISLW